MKHIVTYTGERFTPLNPVFNQIHIEDIAHSLSMLCRANGNIDRFYSVAQHSINCANEAKSRNYSARVQLACLLHDGSEAYISDITRPVKYYLTEYQMIEKRLQDAIYIKFLGEMITQDEFELLDIIDGDILVWEFENLSRYKVLFEEYRTPLPQLFSKPSFEIRAFSDVETEFLKVYYGIMHAGMIQGK